MDLTRLLSLLGIKGKDGSGIASTSNPVPTEVDGATIQVPSDIQGATIQVPMDLQAIYRPQHQSTVATLGIAGTYTSAAQSAANYTRLSGSAFADTAGTLEVQQQDAGGTYRTLPGGTFTILASIKKTFSVGLPQASNTKILYTNGGIAQTAFSLNSFFSVI